MLQTSNLILRTKYLFRRLCNSEIEVAEGMVVILSGVRTPFGSFKGSLAGKSAVELGGITIKQAIKAAAIESEKIDQVYMGHLLQAGCGQSPARQAALLGGCPITADCTTVNKVCASSLKAVTMAAQSIATETDRYVVAGGMESMSNAPFLVSRKAPTFGGSMMDDSILKDGLMCAYNNIHMGECCDRIAQRYKITREQQDDYAKMSYKRAIDAWKNGIFNDEVVPVEISENSGTVTIFNEDEELKKFIPEKIAKLKSAFSPDGTITAANASKISDGACALVLTSNDEAQRMALEPIAKILSFADAACQPIDFSIAPVHAIRKALARCDININDVSLFEINEAFSVVPLLCMKELQIDIDKINIHGGAVSIGHPIGASGARILTHLIHSLQPHQVGVAAICNGGGSATAIVVSKCDPLMLVH